MIHINRWTHERQVITLITVRSLQFLEEIESAVSELCVIQYAYSFSSL